MLPLEMFFEISSSRQSALASGLRTRKFLGLTMIPLDVPVSDVPALENLTASRACARETVSMFPSDMVLELRSRRISLAASGLGARELLVTIMIPPDVTVAGELALENPVAPRACAWKTVSM